MLTYLVNLNFACLIESVYLPLLSSTCVLPLFSKLDSTLFTKLRHHGWAIHSWICYVSILGLLDTLQSADQFPSNTIGIRDHRRSCLYSG